MLAEPQKHYPGELATPDEIRLLADEYRKAARLLHQIRRPGEPFPAPLSACRQIHAIELYLNSLLLHRGCAPNVIRRMQHDLGERAGLAIASGLVLRSRTVAHLNALAESREYLVTRYGPELSGTACEINRLEATLDEVFRKVTQLLLA